MTAIRLSGLSKRYGPIRAIDNISLEIVPGSLTALLGPSGCGKSTILRLIAGLIEPDAGDVAFDGRSVLGVPAERRAAAMVFQNHLLFPHLSVRDNVAFGLTMRGVAAGERARRAAAMLERVKLGGFDQRRPHELSGGQAQRVALARALVSEPRVLLLDEPLSNLDAALRGEMRDLVRELQRVSGITTVLVTHDQEEAVALADRIALLFAGRVHQTGCARDFYERPISEQVARFFGGVNFWPGTQQGRTVASALGQIPSPTRDLPDGPVTLTVRPEALSLTDHGLPAQVEAADFLGTHVRLRARVHGVTLEAHLPPTAHLHAPGEQVQLALPAERIWVLPAGQPAG